MSIFHDPARKKRQGDRAGRKYYDFSKDRARVKRVRNFFNTAGGCKGILAAAYGLLIVREFGL
jgi:hypothetical protein